MLLIISLTSPKETHDALYLSNFMSLYIKDEIARIPGVGDVTQFGELKYSMRVWVDPDKLASLDMTVDDVVAAIKAQNVQVSAGAVGDAPMKEKVPMRLSISTIRLNSSPPPSTKWSKRSSSRFCSSCS